MPGGLGRAAGEVLRDATLRARPRSSFLRKRAEHPKDGPTQSESSLHQGVSEQWIPAFAGMMGESLFARLARATPSVRTGPRSHFAAR